MKSFYYPARLFTISARILAVSAVLFFISFLNGCSVLVGQVKPVDEKASQTQMVPIERLDPQWKRLELQSSSPGEPDDIPDSAWQSNRTAAVISINSACRQNSDDNANLEDFTSTLLSQWNGLQIQSQKPLQVSGYDALETTAEGIYLKRHRKFQTVVVRTHDCLYDLIYLSPVKTFDQELGVFHRFRDSLKLK